MTIPTWPTDLPRPFRDNFGEMQQDNRRRRSNELGLPRWSPRFSAVATQVQLKLILSPSLEGTFDRFYREDLLRGTQPFWMADPRRDGLPLLDEDGVPMLFEDDTPILTERVMLCLWGDDPPIKGPIKGTEIEVSFTIWDMP